MVILPEYGDVMAWLTAFVAVAILVSGLDDALIDVCYYADLLRRRLVPPPAPAASEAELRALPEKPLAVMIPAWQEHAVIGKMLRNTLATVEYSNYDVFVGTYPNDEETNRVVAEVAEEDPRVHRVVTPRPGPTCKADCLNWVIEGIRRHDRETGRGYEMLALHDCEDVVHPLSFKLMNRFIEDAAMVQLPVIPFESATGELTAGTYLDEFAESHLKDMVVREHISGMVPSAGVGTAFRRGAIERLAKVHGGQVFNTGTFTEDYDLAFRLHAIGERSILVQYFIARSRLGRRGVFRMRETVRIKRELVGTREFFPARFRDAVRQKARWTLGIVFHGWQQRGWEGGLALRYMIWRDRKTLVTNSVNILGYVLLLEGTFGLATGAVDFSAPLGHLDPDSWVWSVLGLDAALLANRCLQRVVCIARVSDWRQGLLSLPRIIWGNVINFLAVARATRQFAVTVVTGRKPAWAKTAHAYPSEEQLRGMVRSAAPIRPSGVKT